MRIGSLFSGAGGLDMAVEEVFGGEVVWQCEFNDAASKVLAHRYPGVPNFGDVTTIDWDTVEPVDVMCGGYPCQPFSAAGQRKGTDDERHLWPYFAEAIRRVRPRYVVLENVAGHRSMGFDCVLGDLARIGYDAQWCSVRASDVGAPHRRERVFILAHPAGQPWRIDNGTQLRAGWGAQRPGPTTGPAAVADAARDGRNEGGPESARIIGGPDAAQRGHGHVDLLPTPRALDSTGVRGRTPNRSDEANARAGLTLTDAVQLLPTPSVADGDGGHLARSGARSNELLLPGVARAYGNGELLSTPQARDFKGVPADGFNTANLCRDVTSYGTSQWGKYEPAIRRWEQLARPAPSPTEPNTRGNPRLAAPFPEWMMGWPAGWVTDVPGISRNDQLRIIGNGVVPQCAAAALRYLLSVGEMVA